MQTINELIMIKTKRLLRFGTELRGRALAYQAKGSMSFSTVKEATIRHLTYKKCEYPQTLKKQHFNNLWNVGLYLIHNALPILRNSFV